MLQTLKIKNFALIDDLKMDFQLGLTALTGETGTGKSIIMESLQLLFGKRSDSQMIRHGEKKAIVSGCFRLSVELQETLELPKHIEIEREVDSLGRHTIRINKQTVTLGRLKEIMNLIGSIHSQNETMNLFDRTYYLVFVDQVDQKNIDKLLHHYLIKRSYYITKKQHFDSLKKQKNQSVEKQSFLEFQVNEITELNLFENEREALEEQIEKLKNYDKIMSHLRSSLACLGDEQFPIDRVYQAASELERIKDLDSEYKEMGERLLSAYYDLDDIKSRVYAIIDNLDFDEEEFDRMQERSYELLKIEQKYQKSTNELIIYLKDIKEQLLMITNYDSYIIAAKDAVDKAFNEAFDCGMRLSKLRIKLANKLTSQVLLELKDLDLEKAVFEIEFAEIDKEENLLNEFGLDNIEFYISLNEGEPVKPLARVASGGERARFMFALKSIYAKANNLSLLILDEIDIGISGKTAAKVATKMSDLSKEMQLLIITHLPQVAARANHHFGITKIKEKARMVTRIKQLDEEERIEMIALMLSDEKLSHFAIEQAKVLLQK